MDDGAQVSRRHFFRTGLAAAAAGAALPAFGREEKPSATPEQNEQEVSGPLPTRKLGRTGVDVTMLGLGCAFPVNNRHLNIAHKLGVRYLDTAKVYLKGASERGLAEWFDAEGKRKEHFVVTKDLPLTPDQIEPMIDERLEALHTDYIDLFFLHGMGDDDHYHGVKDVEWFKDAEWLAAIEKVRKSGKCRFFGFSTHSNPIEVRTAMLNGAAQGGWVDAIMVAADPASIREHPEFNKALDACHKAGVGLVSMKECRGAPDLIGKVFPTFEEKGLSAYTAVLYAMWTDERFACTCSHMDNVAKLEENAKACKEFKPLLEEELIAVNLMLQNSTRTYCLACDGSCQRAAGTKADLNKIARYVSYAEQDGRVYEARELLQNLPDEARNVVGADLSAASKACRSKLNFEAILKRAGELLA